MLLPEEFNTVEQEFRAFTSAHVTPYADSIDRHEQIPEHVIRSMAEAGLFAAGLPKTLGGTITTDRDSVAATIRQGLLHEALGTVSASVQGLANVHNMAAAAIARWGSHSQKQEWVPKMAAGELIGAVAITEPDVGSDAAAVKTTAINAGADYLLDGRKVWITCGQIADLFVLLAGSQEGPVAFILPRSTPGLSVEPIKGILGCRGYMLAKLHLDHCRLTRENLLGRAGFGLTHVLATSLDAGRFNLAWGCAGLAKACLDAAFDYTKQRRQFNTQLSEFQMVQRMIARMMTDLQAARLLCWHAACLRGERNPAAIKASTMAKYFASTMVNRVAYDAVQIHGANGCGPDYPLERFYRDARVMEIIEGSTQILEIALARYGYQERL